MSTPHKFSVIAQNLRAASGLINDRKYKASTWQMCWKCQKDRPLKGGQQKFFGGGLRRFICKACIDQKASAKANNQPNERKPDGI